MGGIVKAVVGGIFGGGDKPQAAQPAPAPAPVPSPPAERSKDFDLREQSLGQRASAAGAVRSDNEADLLGYTPPRKRSVSREILG
jgi:hypothetical protein